jgi:molybdopterin converting factor subunit 1
MSRPGTVLLFGRLKDAFGADHVAAPADVATAAELRSALAATYPELADLLGSPAIRIALNKRLVTDEASARINPGDEIALLPPLSGG